MASLTAGDSIDWLWGGLKPWQILHSTLAERERCGSVLDVWELVNQTLSTSTKNWNGHREEDRGRSHEIQFLGDLMDADFWRHGGVIETRVKECLNSLVISQNHEAEQDDQQLPEAHHRYRAGLYKCNSTTEVAIASSTHELPCIAWEYVADANHYRHTYCKTQQEATDQAEINLEDDAAAAADDQQEEHEEDQGPDGYGEEETEEEEEDQEEDDNSANRRHFRIREANSGVGSRNHLAGPNYREDGTSILVLNPCCSASVASTARDNPAASINDGWGDQSTELPEGSCTVAPVVEDNIEVCAVCLEKLTHYYEEGVQALDCRHAFHTVCIEPWLQRQPHACCPCCRAPICADTLAPPLHFSADHRLQEGHYGCSGGQLQEEQPAQRAAGIDIMGVLADMEAALERLGFRS